MKGLKLVGYCRVSTINQKEGKTIELQTEELKKYCKEQGHQLVEIFKDDGVSGGNGIEDRIGLPELLRYCETNLDVNGILILKLDRLARDLYVQEYFIKKLEKLNIGLYSIKEPDLMSHDPMRKAFRQFMGIVSELEKNFITMRLSAGRNKKARKGEHAGSAIPLGYEICKKIENDRKVRTWMAIEQEEAEIVKWIFKLRKKKYKSLSEIARLLNEEKVPTKRGGKWYPGTIKYILENPVYKGIIKYGDIKSRNGELKLI